MKRILLLLFAALATIIGFAQSQSDKSIDGIGGLLFGMEKSECIVNVNKLVTIPNEGMEYGKDSKYYNTYVVENVTIDGLSFELCILGFYDNKLYSCILSNEHNNETNAYNEYYRFVNFLNKKYGKVDEYSETLAIWRGKNYSSASVKILEKNAIYTVDISCIDGSVLPSSLRDR